MHRLFSMYLFLFITLYMFRVRRAHHQERQIVSIQTLVTAILKFFEPAHISATNIDYLHIFRMTVTRGCIDTICLS